MVAMLVLFPARGALASAQDRITVDPGRTVTREFPAIVGVNPAPKQQNDDLNAPGDPDPGTCANLPSCDVIPLTVVQPPGLSVFDSFSLEIELRWDAPGDDLDLYFWYDPQGTVVAKKSVTTAATEKITFQEPTSKKYQIVVNNAAGINSGYTLRVTSRYVHGDRPSDLDAGGSTTLPFFQEDSPSAVRTPTTNPLAPAPDITTTTAFSIGDVDPDLGGLSASGPAPQIFRDTAASTGHHKPVGGGVVALWSVVVPSLVLFAVLALLYRRRPKALSYKR
jgi:hypothetical protein